MVCITKPCSHRPRNVAKLKIYLSIFCTTNGLLHASSTHAHLLHALSMHTLSMHHPCTHTCLFLWTPPCIIHAHAHLPVPMDTSMHHPRTHTFCLFLWTPPCIIHAPTPACSYGHLHVSSTHTHLLPASFMHTCLHHACIPSMQPVSQWQ